MEEMERTPDGWFSPTVFEILKNSFVHLFTHKKTFKTYTLRYKRTGRTRHILYPVHPSVFSFFIPLRISCSTSDIKVWLRRWNWARLGPACSVQGEWRNVVQCIMCVMLIPDNIQQPQTPRPHEPMTSSIYAETVDDVNSLLLTDPLTLFNSWFDQAQCTDGIRLATSACLATASRYVQGYNR